MRQPLIDTARRMAASGLNRGTAGNLSVRCRENGEDGFLITPTGLPYDELSCEDAVFVSLNGTPQRQGRRPSSEWRLHRDIYATRARAGAVLHAHSPFATTLACLRRDVPAFHYMIARFGGDTLRCADYATFGTQALSDHALAALGERSGCLLANHGMLVYGDDAPQTLIRAIELEELCEQYWRALQIGEPVVLEAAEMARVLQKFSSYGRQDAPGTTP